MHIYIETYSDSKLLLFEVCLCILNCKCTNKWFSMVFCSWHELMLYANHTFIRSMPATLIPHPPSKHKRRKCVAKLYVVMEKSFIQNKRPSNSC